jgi:EF-P beta-lysylation protein EpmB
MNDLSLHLPASAAPRWQQLLGEAISRPEELLRELQLDPALPWLDAAQLQNFTLRVPRGYVARMRKGDPQDPLFLQVWPQSLEARTTPGYQADVVGDLVKLKSGGVIHKYDGRALVISTGACAIHCRYCFRRHFPYGDNLASRDQWRETLRVIAEDPSIGEVILSGGDPLALSDDKLETFVAGLAGIPTVRRLRVHTRLPVVLPERVDERMLAWLRRSPLQKVVVIHANHPREFDESVSQACRRLHAIGVTVLNQSVLLKGINDSADILAALSEELFRSGVLPYYLHEMDRVLGAGHFEVEEGKSQTIMRELNARLPGYLVPRLVREVAGAPGKTPVPW